MRSWANEIVLSVLLFAACALCLYLYNSSKDMRRSLASATTRANTCERSVADARQRADRAYEDALTKFVAPAALGRQQAETNALGELTTPATNPEDDAASARDRIRRYNER